VGARFAEDAQRQDHAENSAQNRCERDRQPGRYIDARRSRGGERAGGEPDSLTEAVGF